MSLRIRRHFPLLAALAILVSASLLQAQSLAEAARHNQGSAKRTAAKVYTNDDLPRDATISILGRETPLAPPKSSDSKQPAAAGSTGASVDKANSSPEPEASSGKTADPGQRDAELQKNAAKMKEEIALLERELDLLNREFRLRAAAYYADAGNSLRNPKDWAEQQRQHETQVKEKQAALEAAKQKFADLQEQARRAGVKIE
jgi:hypothetical protein